MSAKRTAGAERVTSAERTAGAELVTGAKRTAGAEPMHEREALPLRGTDA
jgi:hypothetical protein